MRQTAIFGITYTYRVVLHIPYVTNSHIWYTVCILCDKQPYLDKMCIFYNWSGSLLSNTTFSNAENMGRLRKCLKGRALAAVQSMLSVPANFSEVLVILEDTFGHPNRVIGCMIEKVKSLEQVSRGDLSTLVDFSNALANLVNSVEQLHRPEHLANPQLREDLVRKLPTPGQPATQRGSRSKTPTRSETAVGGACPYPHGRRKSQNVFRVDSAKSASCELCLAYDRDAFEPWWQQQAHLVRDTFSRNHPRHTLEYAKVHLLLKGAQCHAMFKAQRHEC